MADFSRGAATDGSRGWSEPKASATPGTDVQKNTSPEGATERAAKVLSPLRGLLFYSYRLRGFRLPAFSGLRSTPGYHRSPLRGYSSQLRNSYYSPLPTDHYATNAMRWGGRDRRGFQEGRVVRV